MYMVLSLLGLLPILVFVQIVRLALFDGSRLRAEGVRQAESSITIPAMRGMILDREGRVLATNETTFDLAVDPTYNGFPSRADEFHRRMARLTGRRAADYGRLFRKAPSPRYVHVARGLTEQQGSIIESWDIPGIVLTPKVTRRHNYRSLAAQLIGHVSAEGEGLAGIEQTLDETLRGYDGFTTVQRDRMGRIKAVVEGEVVEPRHGNHIVLTIDLVRQAIMEEELARGVDEARAVWGVAIAMDPKTGAILGMANVPTYDPDSPGSYGEASRRNRAVTDKFEPGSTFKLVAAAAAVDLGLVTMDEIIDTGPGREIINGRTMRDTHENGRIPFTDVIALSSNIGVAKVALRLSPSAFYQYARNFGFGQQTGIELPGEVAGTLKKPQDWSGITLPWMSHGYEVEATPLQVLLAYSALANGGTLYRPYVVSEERDVYGRTVWSRSPEPIRSVFEKSTAEALLPAFERVVTDGTGKPAAVEGLRIAGKTGTAQKAENGAYARGKHRATFAGFFPADDPQVALVIVLDEPEKSAYGGIVAAPIFGSIARRWMATIPAIAPPTGSADHLADTSHVSVPEVRRQPVGIANSRLAVHGLDIADREKPINPFALVADQMPAEGTDVPPATPVRINVAALPAETQTPDLIGLSCRHAVNMLVAKGIRVRVEGYGRVVRTTGRANAPAIVHCE